MVSRALPWFLLYDYQYYVSRSTDFSLQATSKDGKDGGVELIQPPPDSKPGDRVYFEGPEYESKSFFWYFVISCSFATDAQPLSQLNPKKKIFETIQPGKAAYRVLHTDVTILYRLHHIGNAGGGMGQPSHEECTPNSHQEWSVPGADLCWSLFVVDALIYDPVAVAHKPECLSNVVRQLGLALCAYEQMSDHRV